MPTLEGIVAFDKNRLIGKGGKMPWHISKDFKVFKSLTEGNAVLMGRTTFDSLPNGPLPNRKNIVLTRNHDWHEEGVEVIHSLKEIHHLDLGNRKLFIMGGAQIYRLFLPYLKGIFVSRIHQTYEGDAYFPEFEESFKEEEEKRKSYKDFDLLYYKNEKLISLAI